MQCPGVELNTFSHSSMTKHVVFGYTPLKHKSKAFDHFLEWKALVENASGNKLKVLRIDNGGEVT